MQNIVEKARDSEKCFVCGREKQKGTTVCWENCWYGKKGLKHYIGDDETFLKAKAKKEFMQEEQYKELVNLLEMFVEDCGLDNIDACKQAQKLLDILNDK